MSEVFKTKWGYVAYSYEDYAKLKRLNLIFQKARANAARWKRWVRKAPHNRIQKKKIRNEKGQKTGYNIGGPLPEPVVCDLFSKKLVDVDRKPLGRWFIGYIETDNKVETEYKKSRKPIENVEDVIKPGFSSADIEELFKKAEKYST